MAVDIVDPVVFDKSLCAESALRCCSHTNSIFGAVASREGSSYLVCLLGTTIMIFRGFARALSFSSLICVVVARHTDLVVIVVFF